MRARLAFSRDRRVSPEPSSTLSSATSTVSPTADFDLALLVLELLDGNDGFGLESDVDDDEVLADIDDQAVEDRARTNALVGEALFEQFRETFCHVFSINVALARVPRAPGVTITNGGINP